MPNPGVPSIHKNNIFLGPAVGQEPIKLILPEFVSYLGERGVLCVGNG